MNTERFKLYDAAIKDLLKLQKQLTHKEFCSYGYAAQLEMYRVEATLALQAK